MGFRNIIIILVLVVLATTSYAITTSWEAYTPDGQLSVNKISSGTGSPPMHDIDWGVDRRLDYQLKIINEDYAGDNPNSFRVLTWPESLINQDFKYIWYTIAKQQCLYIDDGVVDKGFGCCGDFKDKDLGVITQPGGSYLCSPTDYDGNSFYTGDYVWIKANEEPFIVYSIDRTPYGGPKYDVISNSDSWYACDTPGGILAPDYTPVTVLREVNDPLTPPPESVELSSGIDVSGGGAPGNDNADGDSGTDEAVEEIGNFGSDWQTTGADTTGDDNDGDGYPDDINDDGDSNDANEDCDDTNPDINPGEIEYPNDGIDQNCDGEDTSPNEDFPVNLTDVDSANELAARFICSEEDEDGRWAECVGYDLNTAINTPRARRVGNILTTLREFDGGCTGSKNCVSLLKLKLVTPPSVYSVSFQTKNGDAKISDWTKYKTLSFFIYFSNNYVMDIAFYELKGDISSPDMDDFNLVDKKKIIEYVVNGPDLGKWLKVEIPIIEEYDSVDLIRFEAISAEVKDAGGLTNIGGDDYANVIGLDKIHLVPHEGPKYCSAEKYSENDAYTHFWISDLDDDLTGGYGNQVGKYACEEIPSYGWTGTSCCGDEQKEYYNDTLHGCWAGNRVVEGTRIMTVMYVKDTIPSYEICSKEDCEYYLQGDTSIIKYTNPYPNLYDLNFFESKSTGKLLDIIPNSAETSNAMLKGQNIPLQVMYMNKSFWGCMAVPYLMNLAVDDEGNNIIQNFGPEDVCTVKGKYFCSHDREWSDESIGDISASQRNNQKNGYPGVNLLINSDFEDIDAQFQVIE